MTMTPSTPKRETKRRRAHELYPHPGEWEVQPLAEAVPYLYARAVGLDVWGTGWFDNRDENGAVTRESFDRTNLLIAARSAALHADALLQGLSGEEAWKWGEEHAADESGGCTYERAFEHGIPTMWIKPYDCGPEPDHHDHYGPSSSNGSRRVFRIEGMESECEDCTFVPRDEELRIGFSTPYDDEHWFPFVEDEHANVTGYGHQDPTAFAASLNEYDALCGGEPADPEDLWSADDITHKWVLLDEDGERCWTSWPPPDPRALDIDLVREPVTKDTRGAFPVTTLWGAR